MRDSFSWRDFDWLLFALAAAIAACGIVEIRSATSNTAWHDAHLRQTLWFVSGLGLAWAMSTINYRWLVEQTPALYVLTVAGLVGVLMFGPAINGAKRWLPIPGLTNLQVSEFAKVTIVLVVARLLGELPRERLTIKSLAGALAVVGVPAALVAAQPDLSTTLTFAPIVAMGVYLTGVRWKYVAVAALAAALLAPAAWRVMPEYQRDRLTSFLHPERDPRGKGYQSLQSKIAVGSGGLWGQGISQGSQTQLRFLPEAHTDFIFASYAEETGFVGVVSIMALYFALLMRIVHNAQTAADPTGLYICMGVAVVLLFHIAVNIGMVVNRMPVTGMPLPLMSYGGSNMLATFMLLGLVNNVRLRRFTN